MTSTILRYCVSRKQREAIIKILGLKNSYKHIIINEAIDYIQRSIGTYYVHCHKRNCCNQLRYLFTMTFGNSPYLLLSKFYDFDTKLHQKETMYIINVDGTIG